MKKTLQTLMVILTVTGVCFTTSCKKKAASGKVKQVVTTTNGVATTTVNTYDGQGRLIAQSGGVSVAYSQSNVTITSTTGTPTVYTLNNQGLAGSRGNTTFTYDNSGFLTNEVSTDGSSTSYTISNGDVVSSTIRELDQTSGNFITTTVTYTYLSNLDLRNFGLDFLGRRSTHVVNSAIATVGGSSITYTNSYNFDSDGRILTATTIGTNGYNSASTYTY